MHYKPVTPLARLQGAERAFESSQDYCSHWDYENPPGERMDGPGECCANVRGCAHELRLARQAMQRASES